MMDYLEAIKCIGIGAFLTLPWFLFFVERKLRKDCQREFMRLLTTLKERGI